MPTRFRSFTTDERGATAIEYALLGGILALCVITGLTNIGIKLSGYFSEVSTAYK